MTVMAVEAAEGAAGRAGASRAAGSKAAGRHRKPGAAGGLRDRPSAAGKGKTAGTRTKTARPQRTPAQEAQQRAAGRERSAQVRAEERRIGPGPAERAEQDQARQARRQRQVTDRAQSAGRSAAGSIGSAQLTPGGRNYQGVILAEFLVAVLVVAFLPLASGPSDDKAGPSPYRVNDMIQLVAIGAVYFILALFSSGEKSGRIVAWFGGLLTLGILIAKVGSGQLSAAVSSVSGVSKADLDNT